MNAFGRHRRKIDPTGAPPPEYSPIGPANPAQAEWAAAGLEAPDLSVVRAWRLERLRQEMRRRDIMGGLFQDPINIRYATDVSNMQVWCLHNAMRYVFVATEGPVILFDYESATHLAKDFPLIDESRPGIGWFYMNAGTVELEERMCRQWAAEIAELVDAHGGGNRRLVVDKLELPGALALQAHGIEVIASQEVPEEARKIKHPEEIKAMRRALHVCQTGVQVMADHLRPGLTENQLWAKLHETNIARGGEWIETRILCSGPRTNPWYHECSDRVLQAGDMLAFDTDLIGPYGYCADISRSWVVPGRAPTPLQRDTHALALEHIQHNLSILRPGMTFHEFIDRGYRVPEPYLARRYGVQAHGVGLCDEWPTVLHAIDMPDAPDGVFEPGMVVCLEALMCHEDGREGVKMEIQVLIGETGVERLDSTPLTIEPPRT